MACFPEWLYCGRRVICGDFLRGGFINPNLPPAPRLDPLPPLIRDEVHTLGIGLGWIPGRKWEGLAPARAGRVFKGAMG